MKLQTPLLKQSRERPTLTLTSVTLDEVMLTLDGVIRTFGSDWSTNTYTEI